MGADASKPKEGHEDDVAPASARLKHPEGLTFKEVCPTKGKSEMLKRFNSSSTLLGEGGFAKVKLGTQKETGENVAIKITSDTDDNARLEVELLAFLGDHEYIAKLIETYRSSSKIYMIFEYLPNGDLMDLLLKIDRFEEPTARTVARQMLLAIDYCHEHQIAHRDIKGENVLYRGSVEDDNLVCKLADFGAATYFERTNQIFTEKIGSSCYVAPEVLLQRYFPPKADMWSFGATMYTLVNGDPPFHTENTTLVFERVRNMKVELPLTITRHVSTAGQHFIMTLMSRRSWARPSPKLFMRHPWVATETDGFGEESLAELREMEVPGAEDPAQIDDDELLVDPRLNSDRPHRAMSRRESITSRQYGFF